MKNKVILLFGVFSFVLCAMILLSLDWCFDSSDVCLQRKVDSLRNVKAQLQLNIDKINNQINDLKVKFSSGYVIEEAKQGRSQNVPKDLLQSAFHLIPQTYASTNSPGAITRQGYAPGTPLEGEISLGVTKTVVAQKLAKFLAQKQAPFKTTDLLQIAGQEGLTQDEAILALAITGQESKFGTIYARFNGRGVVYAGKEWGESYHNAAGFKSIPDCINQARYPDKDGFYLSKCPDWETFFHGYFRKLKTGYFDRGAKTPQVISKCYVGGDCRRVKVGWSRAVSGFVAEINKALE